MIALLAPWALAALAALLLPVLVHLIRRPEQQPVVFAALRWLPQRRRPQRRLRLHEWLLLALRVLLVTLLVLLLSEPVWRGSGGPITPAVLVAPGLNPDAARAAVNPAAAQWRWLGPGFPSLTGPAPTAAVDLASLIREWDAQQPAGAELTVVVPERLGGLDPERLRLGREVVWKVVPGSTPTGGQTQPALELAIRREVKSPAGGDPIVALVSHWQSRGRALRLDSATPGQPLDPASDALIWLDAEPNDAIRDWVRGGGVAVIARPDTDLARPIGAMPRVSHTEMPWVERREGLGRWLELEGGLQPGVSPALALADFPDRLWHALAQRSPGMGPESPAEALSVAPRQDASRIIGPSTGLSGWLAWLALLVCVVERIWASRPGREAA